jgi:hypothetical protein
MIGSHEVRDVTLCEDGIQQAGLNLILQDGNFFVIFHVREKSFSDWGYSSTTKTLPLQYLYVPISETVGIDK